MRTEAPQPRPRYRNEAVFRSAERLLASPPKKPARRPPSRSFIFLIGLTCGLGVAFWLLRPTRESNAPATAADAVAGTDYVGRKRLNLPRAEAKPTFAATAPAFTKSSEEPVEPTPAPIETPAATSTSNAPRATSLAPRPASRPPAGNQNAPLGFFLTQPTTLIKLRGELLEGPAGRRTVELELYITPGRLSGQVHGLVWLADDRVRGEPFRVSGSWFNRTIMLSEIMKVTHGSSTTPPPHSFVLEFPVTNETDEITGIWSHAGFNGKLVVKSTLPLGWLSQPTSSKPR